MKAEKQAFFALAKNTVFGLPGNQIEAEGFDSTVVDFVEIHDKNRPKKGRGKGQKSPCDFWPLLPKFFWPF